MAETDNKSEIPVVVFSTSGSTTEDTLVVSEGQNIGGMAEVVVVCLNS